MSNLSDPQWRMDRTVFSRGSLGDESDQRAYWFAKTPIERLQAIELMREILYGEDYAAAGFQRVFEITELEVR